MAEIITVKSVALDGKVALWEVHPDHPAGEVFIVGDGKPVMVASTKAVQQRLSTGVLVEVKAPVIAAIVESVAHTKRSKATEE